MYFSLTYVKCYPYHIKFPYMFKSISGFHFTLFIYQFLSQLHTLITVSFNTANLSLCKSLSDLVVNCTAFLWLCQVPLEWGQTVSSRWLCISLTMFIYLFNKYLQSTCSMPGAMVGSGKAAGTTQTWALPHRLILVINPPRSPQFPWFLSSRACHRQPRDSPGSHAQTWFLSDAPELSQGQWKQGQKRSWILNKPGFLSNIVERRLSRSSVPIR